MVPVKQVNGSFLTETTKHVIDQLVHCGLQILPVITDNKRVNGVMFKGLCKKSESDLFFFVSIEIYIKVLFCLILYTY